MSSDVQSALAQLQMSDYGSRSSFALAIIQITSSPTVVVVIVIAIGYDYCKPFI